MVSTKRTPPVAVDSAAKMPNTLILLLSRPVNAERERVIFSQSVVVTVNSTSGGGF
jgi:hypothetical protein